MSAQETTPASGTRSPRSLVLEVAARIFLEKGFGVVTMDDIADACNIERQKLSELFPTEDHVLAEILQPALRHNMRQLNRYTVASGAEGINGIIEMYVVAWRRYPDAMLLSTQVRHGRNLQLLAAEHGEFMTKLLGLLARAAGEHILRVSDPALALRVLSRTAIPLLEIYSNQPRRDDLFRESMRALLFR